MDLQPNFYQAYIEVAAKYLEFKTTKFNSKANEYFEKFFTSSPKVKNSKIYEMYGVTLTRLGKDHDDETYFFKAFEAFEQALKLDSASANLLGNYSSSLSSLAERKKDLDLFEKALIYSKQAIKLESKNYDLITNQADILASFGETLKNEKIITEALDIYMSVIESNNDHTKAKRNYNFTLARLAAYKKDHQLLAQCIKLLEAQSTHIEHLYYNIACLYALLNDFPKSRELLLLAEQKKDLPNNSYKHLLKDSDLDNIRNELWFTELLERLKEKEDNKVA